MSLITLTTDLGLKDYYVSAIKGAIVSQLPDIRIIDITHDIPRFNVAQAAFVIKNVMHDFPDGTIHIIGVMPDATASSPHVAIKYSDQYFIGADNGIFSLIFEKEPEQIVELTISQDTDILTFPTKDIFVKAACHIARGGTLEVIGGPKDAVLQKSMFRPVVDGTTIRGTVIYIDSYGNVITNITSNLFRKVGKGHSFTIVFRDDQYNIKKISNTYNAVAEGQNLALFGETGFMEVSINQGMANELLGLHLGDIVRVEFDGS